MRDLAKAVGCDESMISKIEAGKVLPSLPMLDKMVTALDRDMASFFGLTIDEHQIVQKAEDRLKVTTDALRGGTGVTYERLAPVGAGSLLEANIHIVTPGGEKVDMITHQGEAIAYLISGEIELTIDNTAYRMSAGDSFFLQGLPDERVSERREHRSADHLGQHAADSFTNSEITAVSPRTDRIWSSESTPIACDTPSQHEFYACGPAW